MIPGEQGGNTDPKEQTVYTINASGYVGDLKFNGTVLTGNTITVDAAATITEDQFTVDGYKVSSFDVTKSEDGKTGTITIVFEEVKAPASQIVYTINASGYEGELKFNGTVLTETTITVDAAATITQDQFTVEGYKVKTFDVVKSEDGKTGTITIVFEEITTPATSGKLQGAVKITTGGALKPVLNSTFKIDGYANPFTINADGNYDTQNATFEYGKEYTATLEFDGLKFITKFTPTSANCDINFSEAVTDKKVEVTYCLGYDEKDNLVEEKVKYADFNDTAKEIKLYFNGSDEAVSMDDIDKDGKVALKTVKFGEPLTAKLVVTLEGAKQDGTPAVVVIYNYATPNMTKEALTKLTLLDFTIGEAEISGKVVEGKDQQVINNFESLKLVAENGKTSITVPTLEEGGTFKVTGTVDFREKYQAQIVVKQPIKATSQSNISVSTNKEATVSYVSETPQALGKGATNNVEFVNNLTIDKMTNSNLGAIVSVLNREDLTPMDVANLDLKNKSLTLARWERVNGQRVLVEYAAPIEEIYQNDGGQKSYVAMTEEIFNVTSGQEFDKATFVIGEGAEAHTYCTTAGAITVKAGTNSTEDSLKFVEQVLEAKFDGTMSDKETETVNPDIVYKVATPLSEVISVNQQTNKDDSTKKNQVLEITGDFTKIKEETFEVTLTSRPLSEGDLATGTPNKKIAAMEKWEVKISGDLTEGWKVTTRRLSVEYND